MNTEQRSDPPEHDRLAVITGASAGIGLAIADEFARRGYALLLVARREERLASESQRLTSEYKVPVEYVATDLTAPGAMERVYEAVVTTGRTLQVLVNNAGFATYGLFHQSDLDREVSMIRLNIEALVTLSRLLLPLLTASADHTPKTREHTVGIINVASTAAFQPGPRMAGYYATKAFVLSFSQALAAELARSGVTVSALCPGPTASEFQERSGMQLSKLLRMGMMSADAVARCGVRGFLARRRIVIPGFFNAVGAFSTRLFPRRLVTALVARLQAPEPD